MSAWQRVRQLISALGAELSTADKQFVQANLEPDLQKKFFAMTKGDQLHAVKVAHTAEYLAKDYPAGKINYSILVRCSLLHDIGRGYEAGTPWAKTLAVLARTITPEWCGRQLGIDARDGNYLQRVIYHHYMHPQLGAALLEQAGFCREAELVAMHHCPATDAEVVELKLLRQADEMN